MTTARIKRRMPRGWAIVGAIVATMLVGGTALAVHDATGPMELDGNIVDNPVGGPGLGVDLRRQRRSDGRRAARNARYDRRDPGLRPRRLRPGRLVPRAERRGRPGHRPHRRDLGLRVGREPDRQTDIVNAYGMAVVGDAQAGDRDTADDRASTSVSSASTTAATRSSAYGCSRTTSAAPRTGEFVGSKKTGDILVLSNFTGGGSNA